MVTTLIFPSEVVDLSFDAKAVGVKENISFSQILAAEAKFIQPVFGDIYTAMQQGELVDFTSDYIKPALALCVKAMVLPFLGLVQGPLGLTQAAIYKDLEIDDDKITLLRSCIIEDANALILRAVTYVKNNPQEFKDYKYARKISASPFVGGIIF
ncbi:MAG: hypothetical protein R3Y38_05850 [Rikenellaceae bacterium]